MTFGVVPNAPETGYGYIKTGQQEADYFNIEAFVEKPDLETATTYISSGDIFGTAVCLCLKHQLT